MTLRSKACKLDLLTKPFASMDLTFKMIYLKCELQIQTMWVFAILYLYWVPAFSHILTIMIVLMTHTLCAAHKWGSNFYKNDFIKICITGLFVNGNQLHVGKNEDQKSFWIVSDNISCEDDQMQTDGIVIQNSKVASSICTAPGIRFFTPWTCLKIPTVLLFRLVWLMQYDSLGISHTYNVQHLHGLVSTSELISNVLELKSQQSSKVLQHIMNVLFNVLVLLVVFHSIGNMMDRILNALYTVQVSSHTFIWLIDITARSLRVLNLEFIF